ncbi:argininosuccinate lyase [Marinomonas sp. C2222]|uniref:Argininosuccinate lyase n=1 Tax=Marinomonas sargassi TaxID=2984494 RepID=A0ABT2YUK0_9GAMM|nr:argininosuccinate lyase [Marinomonas sargassi]MCV2403573.1 argininosuccinate lyase [Marinomonas sargassi]
MTTQKKETWSPLFTQATAQDFQAFHSCIDQDKRIALYDVAGSQAHAKMLTASGVLSIEENTLIQEGLNAIAQEMQNGTFEWKEEFEDVHMNVEQRLVQLIGDAGKKLHTARSRNDQVATDIRLYTRNELDALQAELKVLIGVIADLASDHADTIMPGFTHLQIAQPITFGHHMLAYAEMFLRDLERVGQARSRLNYSPLGAAALAGTGFPIQPELTAELLGFDGVCRNSLDAVSDRDYVADVCHAGALIMAHLSRLSEEIIFWCTPLVGFVELGDQFCTGSSIMPQKKNPDLAELLRGKAARVQGNLTFAVGLMKSQPMAFNKDQQESKPPLTDTLENVRAAVTVTSQMIPTIKANKERMYEAASLGYATATDLADYLVRKGLPFRDAHHAVAAMVRYANENKVQHLSELPLDKLKTFSLLIEQDVYQVLTLEGSVNSRNHTNGTAPEQVMKAVKKVKNLL